MAKRKRCSESGLTLMEVTVSVAIFAVVIGASAQALASFYAAIDQQELRIEAMQSCRAVMGEIRQKREQFYNRGDDSFSWGNWMGWMDTQNDDGWSEHARDSYGDNPLREHEIEVEIRNMDGNEAVAGDNPVEVLVTSTWLDIRGREMHATLITIMTER